MPTERYRNVTTSVESIQFDTADPRYKLARKVDMKTGSYGSRSAYSDPRNTASQSNNRFRGGDPGFGRGSWNWTGDGVKEGAARSTNKAVTVTAETIEGSQQTLGNRARVAVTNSVDRVGKAVSSAKKGATAVSNAANSAASSVAKTVSAVGKNAAKTASVISRTVSSSASGGASFGFFKGGFGIGVSRGGLDLGVGFASISYNFSNPNESSIGGFFNTTTITGTQEGCTIFLDYKFLGKTYFTETRQADECRKPSEEDQSKPTQEGISRNRLPICMGVPAMHIGLIDHIPKVLRTMCLKLLFQPLRHLIFRVVRIIKNHIDFTLFQHPCLLMQI